MFRILFGFMILVTYAHGKLVLDYLPQCKRSDPKIEQCFLNGLETMRPKLISGIPELRVPSMDPFQLPSLSLDKILPNVGIKATIQNGIVYGAMNFTVEDLKVDIDNKYVAEMKLVFPELFVTADYDVQDFKVLFFDLSSKGNIKHRFHNVTALIKGIGKTFKREGVEYLKAQDMEMEIEIGDTHVDVQDSNGSIAVATAAAFFNTSPRLILHEVMPIIEETATLVGKATFNKILRNIPLDNIIKS